MLDSETGALAVMRRPIHDRSENRRGLGGVARSFSRTRRRRLAIIGTGVQARSHLEALAHVRSIREVRVWSPRAESRRTFHRRHAAALARADRRGWLGA